jgi:hypothetical protein
MNVTSEHCAGCSQVVGVPVDKDNCSSLTHPELSFYEREIQKMLTDMGVAGQYDVAEVEAWMRLEHGTLDHLTLADFRAEVRTALALIDADPAMSKKLVETLSPIA